VESRFKRKPLLARPFIATRVALLGLAAALRHEVPFRMEVAAAVVLIPLAFFLGTNGIERALLIGSVLLVLVVELVNSAIETTVDRISLEEHVLAGRAKDVSSAAVLMAIASAAAVWGLVLLT
jgi:diacylglycerol kinase (ATP)